MLFKITSKIFILVPKGSYTVLKGIQEIPQEHLHTFQLFIHATEVTNSGQNNISVLTIMILIIRTIQLFKHPPFSGLKDWLLYSKHSNTHVWNYNIPTPTPCGTWTGVTKHLLAFDSLSGATARVTKRLLAYYRQYRMSTRLLQLFPKVYWTSVTAELEQGLANVY